MSVFFSEDNWDFFWICNYPLAFSITDVKATLMKKANKKQP